ncbi:MAG: exosome complex protein Rrp42 [Candidatus Methanomethylicia archaeon]
MNSTVSNLERAHIIELIKNGKRIDNRGFEQYRNISIKTNIITKANGSAQVKLGETYVIAGVKAEVGTPFPDEPNKGAFTINAEFLPLASPVFEPGPPDENSIELARVVDRGIRESKTIPTEELCIIPGRKVWLLWIDLYILNHDGNLIDASAIAALSALATAKIPCIDVSGDQIKILDEKRNLNIKSFPVTMTFSKIDEQIILDPCLAEEEVQSCRLTVTITENGNICSLQKGLNGCFKPAEVLKIVEISYKEAPAIREIIKSMVK